MPLRCKLFCRLDELLTTILKQPKGDVGGNRGAVSAQKPPYRLAEMFALDVPERDIHCADCRGPGAGLRSRIQPIEKIIPVALRRQRVLADEQRGDLAVNEFA